MHLRSIAAYLLRHGATALTLIAVVGGALVIEVPEAAAATAPGTVSTHHSLVLIRPEDKPASSTSIRLTAARNEFESFQIAVSATSAVVDGLTVGLDGEFTGPGGATIPAKNVVVHREEYYTVTTPSDGELWPADVPRGASTTTTCSSNCRIPDALIPERDVFDGQDRNAFPVDVPQGENRVAWIDVLVPADAAPGTYTATFAARSLNGLDARVTVDLQVTDVALPSTSSLRGGYTVTLGKLCPAHGATCGGLPGGDWEMYSRYLRASLDNRYPITWPAFGDPSAGARFDTWAKPYLDGTGPTRLKGARVTDVLVPGWGAGAMGSWKQAGAKGGWADRIRFYCDELGKNASAWKTSCNDGFLRARAAWDSTATNPDPGPLYAAQTGDRDELAWARTQGFEAAAAIGTTIPVVQSLQPVGGGNDRPGYDSHLAADRKNQVWSYHTCLSSGCADATALHRREYEGMPSLHIDQPPTQARSTGWHDFNYAVSGDYYFEGFMDLSKAWNRCQGVNPTNCQYSWGGNGDGTLFYPGTPDRIGGTTHIPVESIRLKRVRDGREDYEALTWLRNNGKGAAAAAASTALFPKYESSNLADYTATNKSVLEKSTEAAGRLEATRTALYQTMPGGQSVAPVLPAGTFRQRPAGCGAAAVSSPVPDAISPKQGAQEWVFWKPVLFRWEAGAWKKVTEAPWLYAKATSTGITPLGRNAAGQEIAWASQDQPRTYYGRDGARAFDGLHAGYYAVVEYVWWGTAGTMEAKTSTFSSTGRIWCKTSGSASTGTSAPVIAAIADQTADERQRVSLPLGITDADGDEVTVTVKGLPAGLSVQGSAISGTIAHDAVTKTTSDDAIADDRFTVEVSASDGTSTTVRTFVWTVRDTHFAMPDMIGFYGCGDCGAGPDEPFPRVSAMFAHSYAPAFDPRNPGAAAASSIWHQGAAPGEVVAWGQPMTVYFWEPTACAAQSSAACQGGVPRGW